MIAGLLCLPDSTPAIALAAAWTGDVETQTQMLQPIKEVGKPVIDMLGEIPYLQMQSVFDAAAPYGMRRYAQMGDMTEISDELIDIVLEHTSWRTSPYSVILLNSKSFPLSTVNLVLILNEFVTKIVLTESNLANTNAN